jgi:hypothetical protein
MAAGLGLFPAAIASGIGSQTQQPLARVVVGGTVTTLFAVLFLVPLMARKWAPPEPPPDSYVAEPEGEPYHPSPAEPAIHPEHGH